MIVFNSKHKFMSQVLDGINDLSVVKSVKNPKTLHVYGVSNDRAYDVAVPAKFPFSKEVCSQFQMFGLNARVGNHWSMAETHNYQVLGLGFQLRKKRINECRKAVVCAFLALNGKIEMQKKKRRNNNGLTLQGLQSQSAENGFN